MTKRSRFNDVWVHKQTGEELPGGAPVDFFDADNWIDKQKMTPQDKKDIDAYIENKKKNLIKANSSDFATHYINHVKDYLFMKRIHDETRIPMANLYMHTLNEEQLDNIYLVIKALYKESHDDWD